MNNSFIQYVANLKNNELSLSTDLADIVFFTTLFYWSDTLKMKICTQLQASKKSLMQYIIQKNCLVMIQWVFFHLRMLKLTPTWNQFLISNEKVVFWAVLNLLLRNFPVIGLLWIIVLIVILYLTALNLFWPFQILCYVKNLYFLFCLSGLGE